MKNVKIGLPFAPSTLVFCKIVEMKRLSISCGGGVGGSFWQEYTKDDFDISKKFITINTNIAPREQINTNNIVKTEPVKVAEILVRNDGHDKYGNVGDILTFRYPVDYSDTIFFDNKFSYDNPKELVGFDY